MLTIEVQNFGIGNRLLLDTMRIDVPVGEIHLLKGPNGCGKSLLLDAVTGVHKTIAVRGWLDGRSLRFQSAFGRWQTGIRRLFQTPTLPADLTVRQVLERSKFAAGGAVIGENKWEETSVLGGVRLEHTLAAHSFGQRRLVELLMALSSGRCCLLDEPFAGMTLSLTPLATDLIRSAATIGRAVLVIDHLAGRQPALYQRVYQWHLPTDSTNDGNVKERHDNALGEGWGPMHAGEARAHWSISCFCVGGRTVLKGAEISMDAGTILLITGPNGSGKSTLLRALARCKQPWEGVYTNIVGGTEETDIHFSPQPPKLIGDLNVRDNLWLMLRRSATVQSSSSGAEQLLRWLGMGAGRLRSRAEVLSGGESSMVALVGACLSQAKVLLLDEPFESFSPETTERSILLLRRACRAGKAVLASTHNPALLSVIGRDHTLDLAGSDVRRGTWVGMPFQ